MKGILSILLFWAVCNVNAQVLSEWRGIGRTGVYTNETKLLKQWPEKGPELLWYVDSIPKGYSSVAIANNLVYFTGIIEDMDVVVAVNDAGKILWQTPFGRAWDSSFEDSRCTPTIDGNKIYLSSGLGDVACVNAKSGELLWKVETKDIFEGQAGRFGYSESVLIVDDKVIFTPAGNKTTMIALNKQNGDKIWQTVSLSETASYASPLLIEREGKKQILNFTENYLFAVNPTDGTIVWNFKFGDYTNSRNNQTNTPLFFNNEIFVTSGYDHQSVMLKLKSDWSGVSVKWVDSVLDTHHGGVVLIDGYIYGSNWIHNRMGNWVCISWETGQKMYSTPWENKGSLIAADGMLYCYEEKYGNIGIAPVNPEKFEITSTFKVPFGGDPYWAHPVISDGRLYVRSATALMVYNIKAQ